MGKQAEEERAHADRFIRHVADRVGRVELGAIPEPTNDFESPYEAAKFVWHMEHATTRMIEHLYGLASAANDLALQVFLGGFVSEQVEEEKWAQEMAATIEHFEGQFGLLLLFDRRWGERAGA